MNNTKSRLHKYLSSAGYSIGTLEALDGTVTTFENDAVLGFVHYYPDAATLIENWRTSSLRILEHAQLSLRQAGEKSWNAYLVLLADEVGDYGQNIILGNIEEDLVGTRKIARAGVAHAEELRSALMPLLGVQNAPRLDKVDMMAEIRLRTSELPAELVEGFLSNASDSVLFQFLENRE